MSRGVLSGIGLGAVFSVSVAGLISVLVPIEGRKAPETGMVENGLAETTAPSTPIAAVTATNSTALDGDGSAIVQPQVSLRAPTSEELPKEPIAAARAPQVETDLATTVQASQPTVAPVSAPQVEMATLAPMPTPLVPVESAETDPVPEPPEALPQPETGTVANLNTPDPLPEDMQVQLEADTPVLPNPQALAPMIPDDSADAMVADQSPPAQVLSEEVEEEVVIVPSVPATTDVPAEVDVTAEVDVPVDVDVPAEADVPTEVAERPVITEQATKPRILPSAGGQGTNTTNSERLKIGTPATSIIDRATEVDDVVVETVAETPTLVTDDKPIRRYARAFQNPEGKPLMSIVLMDAGVDLDAEAIGLPALSSFPYPISFAVDVSLADAAKRMERYRAEGFEVLAMVDLPAGALPSDAEVSISVTLNGLPEVVGILEGTGEGLQGSREVADQVTGILQASGHGLVTQSKGLNSMPKLAVKDGVPAAAVFRDFDGVGQKARVIRRFLDQAAFKADQEGGVIMLGRLRPETIEALLVWGLADRAETVALAPVSAVLLAR
jgi:polysaccharide deacetylase 2 family uncharacterized protein YibQ